MRLESVGASPQAAEAKVKRRIPMSSKRGRPTISPKLPTLTISVVIVRR
jgi:hypothetical protein